MRLDPPSTLRRQRPKHRGADRYRQVRKALRRRLGRTPQRPPIPWPGSLPLAPHAGWVFDEPVAAQPTRAARLVFGACARLARASSALAWRLGWFGVLWHDAVMAELVHTPGDREHVQAHGAALWLRRVIRRAGGRLAHPSSHRPPFAP